MGRGSVVADQPKSRGSNSSENVVDDLIETMLVGTAKAVGWLAWWGVRFPFASTPIVIALSASVLAGWRLGVVVAVVYAIGYGLWWYLDRESFHRVVWQPIQQSWLTWWRYKRSWEHVSTLHGLTARLGERILVPRLQSVNIGATCDVLAVRIVTGQCVADWQKRSDALAEAWRAQRITIRSTTPGELRITLHHSDALALALSMPRPASAATADPGTAVVGVTEAGRWWRLPVLGHHILVAGATGSGKGSVVWSLIAALAPAIRAGSVRLCVVDPKGGMEFGRGAGLFTGFAYDNSEHTLALLRAVVTVMQKRAARLRGHTRLHTPTVGAPLIVLVVDELASLTAYIGDRKIRTEVEQLLGLLLSQGRAVGVSVVAAVQDPSKDGLADPAVVHRAGRAADDRTDPNHDGLRRGRTRCRRGLRRHPHRHTGSGIRPRRRRHRTDAGPRFQRHRRRHRLPDKAFPSSPAPSPTRGQRPEASTMSHDTEPTAQSPWTPDKPVQESNRRETAAERRARPSFHDIADLSCRKARCLCEAISDAHPRPRHRGHRLRACALQIHDGIPVPLVREKGTAAANAATPRGLASGSRAYPATQRSERVADESCSPTARI